SPRGGRPLRGDPARPRGGLPGGAGRGLGPHPVEPADVRGRSRRDPNGPAAPFPVLGHLRRAGGPHLGGGGRPPQSPARLLGAAAAELGMGRGNYPTLASRGATRKSSASSVRRVAPCW